MDPNTRFATMLTLNLDLTAAELAAFLMALIQAVPADSLGSVQFSLQPVQTETPRG